MENGETLSFPAIWQQQKNCIATTKKKTKITLIYSFISHCVTQIMAKIDFQPSFYFGKLCCSTAIGNSILIDDTLTNFNLLEIILEILLKLTLLPITEKGQ